MLLSIGMMVKNEEKHLDECLKSLQPILNGLDAELVIVDTGSTDRTIEIAKKYTKRVYFHEWNNNFSEMRNITISYCTGKWFLCIDGDEVIEDSSEIIEFFNSELYKKYKAADLIVRNHRTSNENDKDYGMQDSTRLFKKDKNFKYIGAVHNQPVFNGPVKRIPCIIDHYGYVSDDKELMERKYIRTSSMLKEELKKNPYDIYYIFQLSVSYSMHGDLKEALEESFKAYNLVMKEKRKEVYMYAIINHGRTLLKAKLYPECIDVCSKALKMKEEDSVYKIDLLYYLGKSLIMKKRYEESINTYLKFINIVEKYNKGMLPADTGIINYCLNCIEDVYNDIVVGSFKIYKYEDVIEYSNKICDKEIIEKLMDFTVESFINIYKYDELKLYYDNKIKADSSLEHKFNLILKNLSLDLNEKDRTSLKKYFYDLKGIDSGLFQLKIEDSEEGRLSIKKICDSNYIEDINSQPDSFGKVIYAAFKNKYDITLISEKISYETLIRFINYCLETFKDFKNILLNYIENSRTNSKTFEKLRVDVVIERILLILDVLDEKEYKYIFKDYTNNGVELIRSLYSNYIIEHEKVFELKNNEHQFFLYMLNSKKYIDSNEQKYVRYLKKALEIYPYMKKGIEILLKEVEDKNYKYNRQMEKLKKELLDNINVLISLGKSDEVNMIINEYEKTFGLDMDVLLLKSQLSIAETSGYVN